MAKLTIILALIALFAIAASHPQGDSDSVQIVDGSASVNVDDGEHQVQVIDGEHQVNFDNGGTPNSGLGRN